MHHNIVKYLWAGRLSYDAGLRLQKKIFNYHLHKGENNICNTLIVLEHYPVYTVGIRDKIYTKQDETKLKNLGADFYRTNRGGLITFHGPGQLVAYPILNLKDFKQGIKWYISQLEKTIIRLCNEFRLPAHTSPFTGVWVGGRKICAIGIHSSRYITTHGLALNCSTNLSWFDHIVPCGIDGMQVTSITEETGANVSVQEISPEFRLVFGQQFHCTLLDCSKEETSRLLNNLEIQELRS